MSEKNTNPKLPSWVGGSFRPLGLICNLVMYCMLCYYLYLYSIDTYNAMYSVENNT